MSDNALEWVKDLALEGGKWVAAIAAFIIVFGVLMTATGTVFVNHWKQFFKMLMDERIKRDEATHTDFAQLRMELSTLRVEMMQLQQENRQLREQNGELMLRLDRISTKLDTAIKLLPDNVGDILKKIVEDQHA